MPAFDRTALRQFHRTRRAPVARNDWRHASNRRMWLVAALFAAACAVVVARLVQLELRWGDDYRRLATQPVDREHRLPGARGRIMTRDGVVLAHDELVVALEVQYRHLQDPVDSSWLRGRALERLSRAERGDRHRVALAEATVLAERNALWERVAELSGLSARELSRRAAAIEKRVSAIRDLVNERSHDRYKVALADYQRRRQPSNGAERSPLSAALDWLSLVVFPSQAPLRPAPVTVAEELAYHEIASHLPSSVVDEIEAHPELYLGVRAIHRPARVYPEGSLAAHVVGHLGAPAHDLDGAGESAGDAVGRMGIEEQYESRLRPTHGLWVERIGRSGRLATYTAKEPTRGHDVILSIDARLQRSAETLLASALARRNAGRNVPPSGGAIVVLDVRKGAVLAAASAPSFDPNLFAGASDHHRDRSDASLGARHQHTQNLAAMLSASDRPFFDRATRMAIPPGSVFKTVTAISLLEEGLISGNEMYRCRGYLRRPDRERCQIYALYGDAHGPTTLADALATSCNTYFFHYGGELGQTRLAAWATRLGFARPTGVDLPRESAGSLQRSGGEPRAPASRGDAEATAIGQGAVTATPIQVACLMAAVANGGYLVTPRIVADASKSDPATPAARAPRAVDGLSRRTLDLVRRGLERVVADPEGTAYATARLDETTIAGKTGTAETGGPYDHAWFAGYASADSPQVAFAIALEHAGGGSEAAAPIARHLVQEMVRLGYVDAAREREARGR